MEFFGLGKSEEETVSKIFTLIQGRKEFILREENNLSSGRIGQEVSLNFNKKYLV